MTNGGAEPREANELLDLQEAREAAERRRVAEFAARAGTAGQTVVAVQGLGFVGTAMAAALAEARTAAGAPRFAVIGVDRADEANAWKIASIRRGEPPVRSSDPRLTQAYARASACGNLTATSSVAAYQAARIVVIDIGLDVTKAASGDARDYECGDAAFVQALAPVAHVIGEDTLVVVETTVPPGMTARVIQPLFAAAFAARGLDPRRLRMAHSYERVMPGRDYLDSITNVPRVFAGIDAASAAAARAFFEAFLNTREHPLCEMADTTTSELAKVLENAYRALNIAFMQEWTGLAEAAGVDLFAALAAIRVRPTHRNIMAPGLGVGGNCLPKDALLADWASRTYFDGPRLDMSIEAIRINDRMPLHAFALLQAAAGDLRGRRVALLGVSYRPGVADTRHAPSALFHDRCVAAGAIVTAHDPMLAFWPEKGIPVHQSLDGVSAARCDAVVLAVKHPEYVSLSASDLLRAFPEMTIVIDANDILTDAVAEALRAHGILTRGVGKGHWPADAASSPQS